MEGGGGGYVEGGGGVVCGRGRRVCRMEREARGSTWEGRRVVRGKV